MKGPMPQSKPTSETYASRALALLVGAGLTLLVLMTLSTMLSDRPTSATGSPTSDDGSLRR